MALRDVGDFMCENRSQFAFDTGGKHESAVYANKAGGCGEGVDTGIINEKKAKRLERIIAVGNERESERAEVLIHFRVINNGDRLL